MESLKRLFSAPMMIFSALGVILFASLSHSLIFNSLLGIGEEQNFVGRDGTGNKGNSDLTTRSLLTNDLARKEVFYSSGFGGNLGESNPQRMQTK